MEQHQQGHRPGKRRKLDTAIPEATIVSATDLHQLLTAHHDSPLEHKTAVLQFKDYLTAAARSPDNEDRALTLSVLKTYSDEQVPLDKGATVFPDLISPWFAAAETNNESILSLIPSVLALYLKFISSQLNFREIGLSLCKYLLSKDRLRLFDRGLTATKTKEHLISPCMRLLTEIVSFDGGEVAHLVYVKRESTLQRLDVFLEGHNAPSSEESAGQKQKPSLRRIAQRYLLANLKFQNVGIKKDLISDGKALKACLYGLKSDKADIVCDVLTTLESHVLQVPSLSGRIKKRLFNSSNLSLLAGLYASEEMLEGPSNQGSPRTRVHKLLRLICTQQENGILLPETGWYPTGSSPDQNLPVATESRKIDLTTSSASPSYYINSVPVRNVVLSTFIQGLRPETDSLQASLLLDIFRAAPELVADYILRKKNFISEPKDTPSWLGQSAFLFSAIQLPVPKFCGWKDGYPALPPPSTIVIESIIPRPLNRTYVTRCLNLNHEVITLFAARVVTAAFRKLHEVLKVYPKKWRQASTDLLLTFSQRCPLPRDVLSTLHRTPKYDEQLRGVITELMAKYHQALPHLMLTEKFDVSTAIFDSITRIGEMVTDESLRFSRFVELENLLQIAQTSSETRWWQKPESLRLSLFAATLRAVLAADGSVPYKPSLQQIMQKVAVDQGVLLNEDGYFHALMTSWSSNDGSEPSMKSLSFFDNCASRIARQPVYYQESAAALGVGNPDSFLLSVCIAEQWPFVMEQEDLGSQKTIGQWIIQLSVGLIRAGAHGTSIRRLRKLVLHSINDPTWEKLVEKQCREQLKMADSQAQSKQRCEADASSEPKIGHEDRHIPCRLEALFPKQLTKAGSTETFEHVQQEEVGELVESGQLGRLCTRFSSPVEENRRQAFIMLEALMTRIKMSDFPEKGPLYVMTGELIESTRVFGIARPLPSILSEFAAGAVRVLNQPSHAMYGKVNGFLQKGPCWQVSRFIRFWLGNILLLDSQEDESHFQEVTWLLNLLIRGLHDDEDLELYRKSRVFEHVLALYVSRICTENHRRQILELVYRSINLGGGMTLTTRIGAESWFNLTYADGRNAEVIQELQERLHDSVDDQAVQRWKVPVAMG